MSLTDLVKIQECGDFDVEKSFDRFLKLAKSLDSDAYPVLTAGSMSDKTKFDTIFEKNLVSERESPNLLQGLLRWGSILSPGIGSASSILVSPLVLNLIHQSISSWVVCGSVLASSMSPAGSEYIHTFRSRDSKKYSFIAVAGANKGRQCITASIMEGGVGHTMVKIKFKSSQTGAWHIFVILATNDSDCKALK